MTRLLNTPDIGRLTACVDSSSIDILAGLSKCPIFRMPPCFWAAAILALDDASSSENAAASTHGPRVMPSYLLFMDGLDCPSEPARFRVRFYCPTGATAVARRVLLDQSPAERAAALAAAIFAGRLSASSISPIERRLVSKPINQKAKAPSTYQKAK